MVVSITLAKHNGAMAVEENAVLNMASYRSGKHEGFDIAANFGQLFRTKRVINTLNILLNDGALIQVSRHVMSSGANDFDATVVSLVIRLGTLEARQKAVMNIDGFAL